MIYKIGNIETEFENFVTPTQELFKSWKEEFLKLPSINNYNVWLCGGFINDWDTFDIDIILTNKPNYLELRELLIQGFKIGIKNNKVLAEIISCGGHDPENKENGAIVSKNIVYI